MQRVPRSIRRYVFIAILVTTGATFCLTDVHAQARPQHGVPIIGCLGNTLPRCPEKAGKSQADWLGIEVTFIS